ncbi:hypothetical protein TWF718_009249 [Orbilia javanica]|uniref:Uncharacterized protein n=1 Tax=Orbilia javanica TaxID=47235 RepID=A0AAN8RGW2_9PEZI
MQGTIDIIVIPRDHVFLGILNAGEIFFARWGYGKYFGLTVCAVENFFLFLSFLLCADYEYYRIFRVDVFNLYFYFCFIPLLLALSRKRVWNGDDYIRQPKSGPDGTADEALVPKSLVLLAD